MTNVKFTPVKSQLENRFAIVLDESGSMLGIRQQTVDAFNSILKTIKDQGAASGQKNTITLCIFNGFGIRFVCVNQPVSLTSPLTTSDYTPGGGTPLWDAVGDTITKLREVCAGPAGDSENVSMVLNVITDGHDTGGQRWCMQPDRQRYGFVTHKDLMAEIRNCEKNGRWTFAFMVPKGTGLAWCSKWGIPQGNVQEWEATAAGIHEGQASMAAAVTGYTVSRSMGAKSVQNYFTTDMSKVKTDQVKKLEDLSDRIKIYEVKEQTRIDEFAQKKNKGLYVLGAGFYQLMKKEKVQGHKQVLLREKGKQAIYGGDAARKLLNLPDYELTINPGNHANFDVFVQSKAPNRILPRGTFFAYDHSRKVGETPTWGTTP